MTRKEAVAVLEAFIENPLFSNTHKAAFNIAIHDIKQRHDWDINNLILIKNGTPHDVLDNLRAEINAIEISGQIDEHTLFARSADGVKNMVLEIIDRYRNEVGE